MPTIFHPDHAALAEIFGEKMRYVIPEYQRPYSWQAEGKNDRNNQINQLWDDLWAFFCDQDDEKEYFLGSMVIIEEKLRQREVVDGQQRLTSLLLLFTAMRCFLERCLNREGEFALTDELKHWANQGINKLQQRIYDEQGFGIAPELKVKIGRSAGHTFDDVLNSATRCEDKSRLKNLKPDVQEMAARYFDNRDYFVSQLEKEFLEGGTFDTNGRFTDERAQHFDRFFSFLQTRVAIVLIKTTDFDTAFSIFEILNDRGLPLSNVDLFRNFLINELQKASGKEASQLWYRLEQDYALTEDFMSRWVESHNGAKQRASAFNSVRKIYEDEYQDSATQTQATQFSEDLEKNLMHYSLIVEPEQRIEDLEMKRSLQFIRQLGNPRYSSDLILTVFRHFNYEGQAASRDMLEILRTYERYALFIQLRPGRRFSSTPVFEAIRRLNNDDLDGASKQFHLTPQDLTGLKDSISSPMDTHAAAKLLLAAYIWFVEPDEDVVNQQLSYSKATLEHIMPVSPAPGSNWLSDFSQKFRDDYTQRLGNMTLLTQRMNSAAKNSDFSRKRQEYKKTQLPMTRTLAERNSLSEADIVKRHETLTQGLFRRWGL